MRFLLLLILVFCFTIDQAMKQMVLICALQANTR